MQLKDIDTSKFLYDPKRKESYTKLYRFPEFIAKIPDTEKVIQYIILMYDMNNDELRHELPLYPNRKKEICNMLELEVTPEIEEILIGKSHEVNAMIVKYISLFNNPDLLNLASFYEIYVFLNRQAFSGAFDSKTITDIDRVNTAIQELTQKIFRGKDETELRMELYKTVREQALGIRPEEIAEKLAKGEDPLGGYNPYGNYIPEKIVFVGDK